MPFIPFAATVASWLGTTAGVGGAAVLTGTSAVAGAATSAIGAAEQASATRQAANQQADIANAQAAETRAQQLKLEQQSAANAKTLAEAPGIAAEEARKEDMRRRKAQTKTLLTSSLGDVGASDSMRKTLLGG